MGRKFKELRVSQLGAEIPVTEICLVARWMLFWRLGVSYFASQAKGLADVNPSNGSGRRNFFRALLIQLVWCETRESILLLNVRPHFRQQ